MYFPNVDVLIYSLEENFNTATQTYTGVGIENYAHVFNDAEFFSALKNTFIMVIITVPLSTLIALGLAVGLNAIKPLKKVFQTIFFVCLLFVGGISLITEVKFTKKDELTSYHIARSIGLCLVAFFLLLFQLFYDISIFVK